MKRIILVSGWVACSLLASVAHAQVDPWGVGGGSDVPRGAGGVPTLEIGQEVTGNLASGATGKYGPIPIAAYRFSGEAGQRICTRVGSADDYVHVYLADSLDPSDPPLYSSWLRPNFDMHYETGPARMQGTSFMATLPRSGEYYVYVLAHGHRLHTERHSRPSQRYFPSIPVKSSANFALKLWDADQPEPPSRDPELARTQHPGSMDEAWLGNIAYLLDVPYVSDMTATAMLFSLRDGSIVQHQASIETGAAYPDWVFTPTGRRGEYRLGDGRTLQVQCDGTWTLGTGASLHFTSYGGPGTGSERHFTLMPRGAAPLYAWSPALSTELISPADFWTPSNPHNIAAALELLGYRREEAQERTERQARRAAEDQANQQAMMAGILGGFTRGLAEEAADQQHAQEEFEEAVRRGQQDGLAIRRAEQMDDVLKQMADSDGGVEAVGTDDADAAGGQDADGPGSADGDTAAVASATVLFAKGFDVPITPGATSNEMCFALVEVGPVTAGDGREGEAKRAASGAEQRFLAACRELGALSNGNFADEWYVDDRAESTYAKLRANRWMHEVQVP